jgi:hypothetical protein
MASAAIEQIPSTGCELGTIASFTSGRLIDMTEAMLAIAAA